MCSSSSIIRAKERFAVYIGGEASLSFLQLLRSIVSDRIGPSHFSLNDKTDTMLEKESPRSLRHTPKVTSMSVEARDTYVDGFYAVVWASQFGVDPGRR